MHPRFGEPFCKSSWGQVGCEGSLQAACCRISKCAEATKCTSLESPTILNGWLVGFSRALWSLIWVAIKTMVFFGSPKY